MLLTPSACLQKSPQPKDKSGDDNVVGVYLLPQHVAVLHFRKAISMVRADLSSFCSVCFK